MRRLLGVVYFYLKSNLLRLINDFDEGSDSVPGDGEKEKRERGVPGLFGPQPEEREGADFQACLGREGGDSCVLCSGPRCWLKDPDPRSAGTAWLYHSEHRGLTCCGAARQGPGGARGGVRRGEVGWPRDGQFQPASQPTQHRAVAACLPRVIESMFLCLTSHFRDPRVGPRQREGSYWGHQCNCNVCLLFTLYFPSPFSPLPCFFTHTLAAHAQEVHTEFFYNVKSVWFEGYLSVYRTLQAKDFPRSPQPPRGVRVQLSGRPANDDLH